MTYCTVYSTVVHYYSATECCPQPTLDLRYDDRRGERESHRTGPETCSTVGAIPAGGRLDFFFTSIVGLTIAASPPRPSRSVAPEPERAGEVGRGYGAVRCAGAGSYRRVVSCRVRCVGDPSLDSPQRVSCVRGSTASLPTCHYCRVTLSPSRALGGVAGGAPGFEVVVVVVVVVMLQPVGWLWRERACARAQHLSGGLLGAWAEDGTVPLDGAEARTSTVLPEYKAAPVRHRSARLPFPPPLFVCVLLFLFSPVRSRCHYPDAQRGKKLEQSTTDDDVHSHG